MTQHDALQVLKTGANVFLTGAPGAGKTYTLNAFIEYLETHNIKAAVTASTGIAATHINGMTIHSWSGIGIRKTLSAYAIDELEGRPYLWKRFISTKVLIIDEISMLDADTLDLVDTLARHFKRNDLPFGGMQVVFVGDFFQLPPVGDIDTTRFAFESKVWRAMNPLVCYLSTQFRQDDDDLLSLLTEMRNGGDFSYMHSILAGAAERDFPEHIEPTRLYTHNKSVDSVNEQRLAELDEKEFEYVMAKKGAKNPISKLVQTCLSPEVLVLKEGAVVMCTKNNYEAGFVNGSLGVVVGQSKEKLPLVKLASGEEVEIKPMEWVIEDNGKVKARVEQVPLRLAWAMTVHKSQGMSIDAAEIDLSKCFEYGQGYVALSRVRTLEGLRLLGYNEQSLLVHPRVRDFDERAQYNSNQLSGYLIGKSDEEMKSNHESFIRRSGGVVNPDMEEVAEKKAAKKSKAKKPSTYDQTLALLLDKVNLDEIVRKRKLKLSTVLDHIEKLLENNRIAVKDIAYLRLDAELHEDDFLHIADAFMEVGDLKLAPVKKAAGDNYTYDDLRFARLFLDKSELE